MENLKQYIGLEIDEFHNKPEIDPHLLDYYPLINRDMIILEFISIESKKHIFCEKYCSFITDQFLKLQVESEINCLNFEGFDCVVMDNLGFCEPKKFPLIDSRDLLLFNLPLEKEEYKISIEQLELIKKQIDVF